MVTFWLVTTTPSLYHALYGNPLVLLEQTIQRGQLRPYRKAQPAPELGRFASADIAVEHDRLIEGHHLVAGIARVVRDNGSLTVDGVHQVPNNAVGVNCHHQHRTRASSILYFTTLSKRNLSQSPKKDASSSKTRN